MMHTKFSGSNGQNAHRWLRTLRYENPKITTISPSDWLGIIDGLLEGDAATWADHHPRVKHILRAGSLQEATRADVETFKRALMARFPPFQVKISHSRPGLSISSPVLEQAPKEDLDTYYQRALLFLYQRNGVDLAESPLTVQERDALKKTIRSYIAGLIDDDTRRAIEKVWLYFREALSLQQIHGTIKDEKLLKWHLEHMEGRIPGQAASDQGPNRASSKSDNPDFLSDLGNEGSFSDSRANFEYYFKLMKGKHAEEADDMRSSFADSMEDRPNVGDGIPTAGAGATRNFVSGPESVGETPFSRYGPLPELRPRNRTHPTASPWNQVRNPLPENGFTSRIGNSHHTPNTSYGSNPPITLPNANMFGGSTGTPPRPQSSLFGESPPYSIFDDRDPANVNWTAHPAYRTNNKHFGDGSFTGMKHGNTPQNYSGMPPPGLSRFEPLDKKHTSGVFGDGPAPGRPAKGTSPNRHSRGPSNLKVETHLRPSSLSEDTVRQFYSPGRNIFGHFSTKSPSDNPDAAGPSNTAANTSAQTSHQGPNIKIQPPPIFDTPGTNSSVLENRLPHESLEDYFIRCFGPNRQQDPMNSNIFNNLDKDFSVSEDRYARRSKAAYEARMEKFRRFLAHQAPGLVPEDSHARDTNNNPFKDSMDRFMRELSLDTPPVDADIGPPDENNDKDQPPFPSPIPKTPKTAVFSPINDPTTSTAPSPQPSVTYSQALNTQTSTPASKHAPFQPTVESDPESETPPSTESEPNYEIPITIKQSQGQKKKRRGQDRISKA